MSKSLVSTTALLFTTSSLVFPNCATAQAAIDLIKPQQTLDRNNVDLAARIVRIHRRLVSGGNPARPMTVDMNITSPTTDGRTVTLSSDIVWDINFDGYYYIHSVQLPFGSSTFQTVGWGNVNYNFAQPSVGDGVFQLNRNSGAVKIFDSDGDYFVPANGSVPNKVFYADGEVWTYAGASIVSSRGYCHTDIGRKPEQAYIL